MPARADAGEEMPPPPPPPPMCPVFAPRPADLTGVNNSPDFLVVYDNNGENLEEPTDNCPGDWQDLYFCMKQHPSPDVFWSSRSPGRRSSTTWSSS
ncbi:MAG: hypothetical protein IRZ16_23710 [Myxococcaceae bacterium]|nr:hypothetical protein [Myxococcaceae bacterium]